ncbi:MAG TPA: dihydroxyacetone kinase [Eubacterium sp.]|nr:dihydroxyacetone kinase [Eubacterium sp.]HAZ86973.1 dihydroxyacetone kinase [Eubacterium sp.]
MAINTIDAAMLKKCFLAGAANLEAKKEIINELNVFPVPDGDTGTNMTMTILSAAKEVSNIASPNFENLSKAISGGSLRGARGNSGVILSQLFRGFTKEIKSVTVIDAPILARAFQKATETAYKAVMKPKEGTILTVAKGLSDKMNELACENGDLEEILGQVLEHGRYVLSQTPEMLPVLKEAGVVDSGGQGLIEVLSGIYDCLLGKEIDLTAALGTTTTAKVEADTTQADIKYGYCTEFIINIEKKFDNGDELNFKAYLESIGDSIVVVADDEIVKVHVHTNDPGLAIQKALTYGSLSKMKIDNMREEHKEKLIKEAQKAEAEKKAAEEAAKKPAEPKKKYGFISVSAGAGLSEIFEGLGVDVVIEGGQTMNPSTEDMLNAIDKVNAENVFILPNNSNIILAANQAQSIVTDKNVYVVPSKTIPQGITALINFDESADAEANFDNMSSEMKNVKTGQVTYAVRDTSMDGKEIKQNDIMGIGDKTILSVGKDIEETTIDMLSQLIDDDSELISVYYGADVSSEQVDSLTAKIEETYPDLDLEVHSGGQPIYYYIVSVE